jgi:N-alpha-acetyltransferase 15/16, NatA auxiliary subunit
MILLFLVYISLPASLTHRAAAAEMMYLLEPDKKMEAIKLIEDSTNNASSG